MKYPLLISVLLLLALVLGTTAYAPAAPVAQDKGLMYVNAISVAGPWEAQAPAGFSLFQRTPQGYVTRAKTTGIKYVHISIPNMYFGENHLWSVSGVEFCGKSSNGAAARATRMTIWSYGSQVATRNISWVNNTNAQCFSINFSPAPFYRDITLTVLLNFSNTVNTFTLMRAEIVTKADY